VTENSFTESLQIYRIYKKRGRCQAMVYFIAKINGRSRVVAKQIDSPISYLSQADSKRIKAIRDLKDNRIVPYTGIYSKGDRDYVVREYIEAESLADIQLLPPGEIKTIVVTLLELLTALQHSIPRAIHGNIKPENIFLRSVAGQGCEIILTDFALMLSRRSTSPLEPHEPERIGFIPPEQTMGNTTQASDNYAVGAVILGLLSRTPTHQMHTLTCGMDPYRYPVREILVQQNQDISSQFIIWLERMLAPDLQRRFPDARTALYALSRIEIIGRPKVHLSHTRIYFQAERTGDQLYGQIDVVNLIPGTVLMGQWQVTPLLYDPGDWIKISPSQVIGNETTISISVDTRLLQADKKYVRELTFQSNSEQPIFSVFLIVKTASLILPARPLPMLHLIGLLIASGFLPIALQILIATKNAS
jgi:serine/threonine protein kinase